MASKPLYKHRLKSFVTVIAIISVEWLSLLRMFRSITFEETALNLKGYGRIYLGSFITEAQGIKDNLQNQLKIYLVKQINQQ